MDRNFFGDESIEEARTRYVVAISLKVLWTFLTLSILLGVMLALTIILKWSEFVLLCLLGLLAGIAIAAGALTSPRKRTLTILLLGVLTLPGFAVYLSFMAGSSPPAFDASNSTLMPFVAYALAAFIGSIITAKIWHTMPIRGKMKKRAKNRPGF